MKENEMDGGMWHTEGRKDVHTELRCGNQKLRDHLKDLDTDGRIISKVVLRRLGREGMGWMNLAECRDEWQGLVNAVVHF
jgi:hypothetical protein